MGLTTEASGRLSLLFSKVYSDLWTIRLAWIAAANAGILSEPSPLVPAIGAIIQPCATVHPVRRSWREAPTAQQIALEGRSEDIVNFFPPFRSGPVSAG